MKNPTRSPFSLRRDGNLIEVWLGPVGDPESDMVLKIDAAWIPALIAILKLANNER